MIKDIDGKRETLKLAVRIVDLWFVESWDSKRNMEMILTDQKVMYHCIVYVHYIFEIGEKWIYLTFMHDYAGQGDVIPAMIKKEDISMWEDKLKEGESYIMHNFKILNNRAQYRVCEHPFRLLFIRATSV